MARAARDRGALQRARQPPASRPSILQSVSEILLTYCPKMGKIARPHDLKDGHYIQRRREKAPLCPAPHSLWTLLYGRIAAVRSACMAGGLRTLRAS